MAHNFLPADRKSEVFYGGAAGGGKSDWLLMGALEYVDIPGYAAIVFRRTFTDLALPGAIMARSREWLTNTDATWSEQLKQWRFPSGATLQFAYMDSVGDELRYQSAEFQYVAFDELTQFPLDQYRYLFSRLRRPESGLLSQVPLRMRAASNPGGIGHAWVKRRFPIDGVPRGARVFIPAKIADNPHLDAPAYRASLSELGEALQKQLEDGNWDAFEGAAYPGFSDAMHIVDPFAIPSGWERFESMDFGMSNPTAWLLYAVDMDGNIVVVDEYYAPGLASTHAQEIMRRREDGWWDRTPTGELVEAPCYPDPSIRNKIGLTGKHGTALSIEAEFNEYGFSFARANNDRRAGYARVRELLKPDPTRIAPSWSRVERGRPAPQLYVSERCVNLIEQLRAAPLAPLESVDRAEAIDGKWESTYGHASAALRYGCLSRPQRTEWEPEEPDDPRTAFLNRAFEHRVVTEDTVYVG